MFVWLFVLFVNQILQTCARCLLTNRVVQILVYLSFYAAAAATTIWPPPLMLLYHHHYAATSLPANYAAMPPKRRRPKVAHQQARGLASNSRRVALGGYAQK